MDKLDRQTTLVEIEDIVRETNGDLNFKFKPKYGEKVFAYGETSLAPGDLQSWNSL